jgi:hypothetical protein
MFVDVDSLFCGADIIALNGSFQMNFVYDNRKCTM